MKRALLTGTAIALFCCVPAQASEAITYIYDAKGRLIRVDRAGTVNNGVSVEYSHDKASNRKQVKVSGSPNPPQ
jgi:hypothetical protein